MPNEILMPALSPTMTEGNIVRWIKKEGEKIKAGEVIAEVETDKAVMEVEAVDQGVLKILAPAGSKKVLVHSLIAVVIDENEDENDVKDFIASYSFDKSSDIIPKKENKGKEVDHTLSVVKSMEQNSTTDIISVDNRDSNVTVNNIYNNYNQRSNNDRVFASPLARRIAKLENILLSRVIGTGPHGRIIKEDVLNFLKSKNQKITINRSGKEFELIANSNMRNVIAEKLLSAKQNIPHFYLNIECKVDAILEMRSIINEHKVGGSNLSVNDFIIVAAAKALADVPEVNASWNMDSIMRYNNIDIAVAVAVEGGLVTPIIKNADQKDIFTISLEIKELIKRARNFTLIAEEYQGGGFTISNLGMYGIKNFNAIINSPQSCIIAVGQSTKRTIIEENTVKIKTIMDINLSCDHRVVDGVVGAQFLAALKKYIELPILLFI